MPADSDWRSSFALCRAYTRLIPENKSSDPAMKMEEVLLPTVLFLMNSYGSDQALNGKILSRLC